MDDSKKFPGYLKLHRQGQSSKSPRASSPADIDRLTDEFEQATGWSLAYHPYSNLSSANDVAWSMPINVPDSDESGCLSIVASTTGISPRDIDEVVPLASSIGELVQELHDAQHALWKREAELATAIPTREHPSEEEHLARRLRAVLKGGAEAVGCHAAALYLLDEATTQLKLRSSWQLPAQKLLSAARPLHSAIGDLEALSGHAVVLEDTVLFGSWNVPDVYAGQAAVCVPVSSPTVPLGTVWFFSDFARDFTDEEMNMLEIIAGRIASDLEREVLLNEGVAGKTLERQVRDVARASQLQMPQASPPIDGLDVAAWSADSENPTGEFYNWFVTADGLLAVVVARVHGNNLEAAMTAGALNTAILSHGQYPHGAHELLMRTNETIWTSTCGDQAASMIYALVDPKSGNVQYALAGQSSALILGPHLSDDISFPSMSLGLETDVEYEPTDRLLRQGDALVIMTDDDGTNFDHLSEQITALSDAEEVIERVRWQKASDKGTILVVRRCGP